jgi:DNA-binding transcriptional regulator YiaG
MMGDINDRDGNFTSSVTELRPAQCRAARALLNWTQQHLADRAHVARATVRDFENERHRLHGSTKALIVAALVAAGIGFIADAGLGFGVYLHLTGDDVG